MLRIGSPRAVQTRVVLMVAIAGCGGSSGNGELAAETHETTTTQAKTTVVEPSITGFGATDSAWNSAHREDTNYAHESVYNENPALPEVDGASVEYAGVGHAEGHVTRYEYRFKEESAAAAKEEILREQFPPDASIFDDDTLGKCEEMLVRSPTIVKALGLPAGTVAAQIELGTGVEGEESFNPSSVDAATLSEGYRGIESQKPEC